MTHSEMIGTLKAQMWEEAKGKLRSLIAIEGSISSHGEDPNGRRERWPKLEARINAFIQSVEDDGLHE